MKESAVWSIYIKYQLGKNVCEGLAGFYRGESDMWVCGFRLMTNGTHWGQSPQTQYKTKRISVCVLNKVAASRWSHRDLTSPLWMSVSVFPV